MRAKELLRNLNVANQLTFLRLVAVPFFIISILQSRFGIALALFVAAGVTDLLDGLTARMFQLNTPLGAYLDPAADKLLMTSAFVLLTEYPSMFRDLDMVVRLPIWLTILTIFRDLLIVGISLMLYLIQHQTRFTPSLWGKCTTAIEMVLVGAFLLANFLGRAHPALDLLVWATLALTLFSGFHYMMRTIRSLGAAGSQGAS